jgi:hypothetical protein
VCETKVVLSGFGLILMQIMTSYYLSYNYCQNPYFSSLRDIKKRAMAKAPTIGDRASTTFN